MAFVRFLGIASGQKADNAALNEKELEAPEPSSELPQEEEKVHHPHPASEYILCGHPSHSTAASPLPAISEEDLPAQAHAQAQDTLEDKLIELPRPVYSPSIPQVLNIAPPAPRRRPTLKRRLHTVQTELAELRAQLSRSRDLLGSLEQDVLLQLRGAREMILDNQSAVLRAEQNIGGLTLEYMGSRGAEGEPLVRRASARCAACHRTARENEILKDIVALYTQHVEPMDLPCHAWRVIRDLEGELESALE